MMRMWICLESERVFAIWEVTACIGTRTAGVLVMNDVVNAFPTNRINDTISVYSPTIAIPNSETSKLNGHVFLVLNSNMITKCIPIVPDLLSSLPYRLLV